MKIKKYDIEILLSCLLIFGLSIGWLYSKKNPASTLAKTSAKTNSTTIEFKEIPPAPSDEEDKKETASPLKEKALTLNQIMDYIQKMVIARAINNIITVLKEECPKGIVVDVIRKIIQNPDIKREEKLHVILALAYYHKNETDIKEQLLEEIIKDESLSQGEVPILIVSINEKLDAIIPHIIAWNKTKGKKGQLDLEKEALHYAAKNDNLKVFQTLKQADIPIINKNASELLLTLVKENRGSTSIAFLKTAGADLNYADPKTKITVLIQAIKNENLETIKQLVKHGADVQKPSEDKNIGYPLQNAREVKQIDIETFLREKGAHD